MSMVDEFRQSLDRKMAELKRLMHLAEKDNHGYSWSVAAMASYDKLAAAISDVQLYILPEIEDLMTTASCSARSPAKLSLGLWIKYSIYTRSFRNRFKTYFGE